MCINLFCQSHSTGVSYNLFDNRLINTGFCQHRYTCMSAAMWCTINIKLFHKWLEIAIIVVPVFKMFSVFCMKQILTFRAGFIPGFVVWQNLVGDWNFSDTILCFTTDNIKILFIQMNIFFL